MYEIRQIGWGSSLVEIALFLMLVSFFVMVVTVVFVVKTFVRYYNHASLWISLAVCIVCCIGAAVVHKLTQFDGSGVLAGIGITVLLITCLVVDLKNRDTLMRENVNLIDEVLHSSWWGGDAKPVELEDEQIAA